MIPVFWGIRVSGSLIVLRCCVFGVFFVFWLLTYEEGFVFSWFLGVKRLPEGFFRQPLMGLVVIVYCCACFDFLGFGTMSVSSSWLLRSAAARLVPVSVVAALMVLVFCWAVGA